MSVHSYIDSPEFFTQYRATLETIDPDKFQTLLDLVTHAIYADPTPFYESRRESQVGATTKPRHIGDLTTGKEVLVEIDGPTRLPGDRLMDARLFTEHSAEHSLGILAFIGTDWKSTTPIGKLTQPDELAGGLLQSGVIISADMGKVDSLWVLSKDGTNKWVTHYDEGRPITDFEYDQLVSDLTPA